mmetsp:Transcript_21988/g.43694  ORF Transcript_21988/g.43694 Transcript_21988/m.43694 type:complete len:834 (+) Transcript_21988:37-2538(+)
MGGEDGNDAAEMVALNKPSNDEPKEEIDLFDAVKKASEETNKVMIALKAVWAYSLPPEGRFHKVWDVFVLLLVSWSAMWEPYKAAFIASSNMSAFEWLIDIIFYVDILVNFYSSYDAGTGLVTDKKSIAKRYLGSWFWVDILATVEWDLVLAGAFNDEQIQFLRLFRLCKVLRLAKLDRLLQRLTASWTIHTGYIEALKFFFYVFIVAHFLGCFFYFLPELWKYTECVPSDPIEEWSVNATSQQCVQVVTPVDCVVMETSWRDGLVDAPQFDKYIDCMYWAITTMTTIGYGDRGPSNVQEIVFVLFAEVFGLTFFAFLLTQINNLNDVIGQEQQHNNEIKNEIVGFMKQYSMNDKLISRVIKYLNFKANSRAGTEMHENEGGFAALSPPLRKEIKIGLLLPYLTKVKLFGVHPEDQAEEDVIKQRFVDADDDQGGFLEFDEIEKLILDLARKQPSSSKFGLCKKKEVDDNSKPVMGTEEIRVAFAEMDQDGEGQVSSDEFVSWHLFKKHKRSRLPKAPDEFMRELSKRMQTIAFSGGDIIVEPERYGRKFTILMSGRATIYKGSYATIMAHKEHADKLEAEKKEKEKSKKGDEDDEQKDEDGHHDKHRGHHGHHLRHSLSHLPHLSLHLPHLPHHHRPHHSAYTTEVSYHEREPTIGLVAMLDDENFLRFYKALRLQHWEARADKFCDACWISRADLQEVIADNWAEVRPHILNLAAYFYELKSKDNAIGDPIPLPTLEEEDRSWLADANAKSDSSGVIARMRSQGETIYKLTNSIENVTTSLNRLDASLDLVVSQLNGQQFARLADERRRRRSPSNSSFSFSSVQDGDEAEN